jgi:hypothetical protein
MSGADSPDRRKLSYTAILRWVIRHYQGSKGAAVLLRPRLPVATIVIEAASE